MNKSSKNVEVLERERELHFKQIKEKRGITLIALVVTIVVLLILAGITINMLFGSDGIFKVAEDAGDAWNEATVNEQESLDNIADQIANLVNGQAGGDAGTEEPEEPWIPPTTIEEAIEQDKIFEETKQIKDNYNNTVTVPKGFKVTEDATTVPEGIVIEDGTGTETTTGNQFVWIPVGTVHKDSNPENDVTIKLGRYTFDTTDGTPTMQQAAFEGDNENDPSQTYASDPPVTINSYYRELTTYREGIASDGRKGLNATAKNLAGFVQSIANNGGYYIARYEASYGSGSSTSDWKPLSKVSTGTPRGEDQDSTPLTQGMLWNHVTQLEASKICQNMYQEGDTTVGVESDLVNSYAWDTAIVFIQSMDEANSNYANANRNTTGNRVLKNTGETGDEVCNIFDMAANIKEWTTEYSTYKPNSGAGPCVGRGGIYNEYGSDYTANRSTYYAITSRLDISFREVLYVK